MRALDSVRLLYSVCVCVFVRVCVRMPQCVCVCVCVESWEGGCKGMQVYHHWPCRGGSRLETLSGAQMQRLVVTRFGQVHAAAVWARVRFEAGALVTHVTRLILTAQCGWVA
jgi:hypothetical protein